VDRAVVKAVVHDRYGPPEVLRIEDVPEPELEDDRVLVRVHATTVTRSDVHWREAHPFISRFFTGLRRPKYPVLGSEFAGVVERVGTAVTEFTAGDRVFGSTGGFRAHAELVAVRESSPIVPIPEGFTFEQVAAASDGPILVLNALQIVPLEGKRLLVYGASGSMGTAAVQLGKHLGAHVTAVTDLDRLELVRELGADAAIDYTREDWLGSGETWDVIIDTVGRLRFLRIRRALADGGVFLPSDGFSNFFLALPTLRASRRVRVKLPPRYLKEHLQLVTRLLEEGRYRAVVDRTYPLDEIVEASRYVGAGQKTGNVVITVV
jgi:NADPH:quinone reductase-like Zn-dependent oxidoreductase